MAFIKDTVSTIGTNQVAGMIVVQLGNSDVKYIIPNQTDPTTQDYQVLQMHSSILLASATFKFPVTLYHDDNNIVTNLTVNTKDVPNPIAVLAERVSSVEKTVSGLQGNVATLNTAASNLQGQANVHEGRIESLENVVVELEEEI